MPSNLYVLPAYGKAITLDDQGVYCVFNQHDGAIQSVIQLLYENDDWTLYQLQRTSDDDALFWTVMSDSTQCRLSSMTSVQIAHYLAKPEYAEPRGAWQMMRNAQYGFGKFTPIFPDEEVCYAVALFTGDELRGLVRLHKADAQTTESVIAQTQPHAMLGANT
ncbi:MAG TPA: hypothetical protein VGD04_04945 [Methylophilus sp.]